MRFVGRIPFLGDEVELRVPLIPNVPLFVLWMGYAMLPEWWEITLLCEDVLRFWIVNVVLYF